MTAVLGAFAGAALVGGLVLVVAGCVPVPPSAAPPRTAQLAQRMRQLTTDTTARRRQRIAAAAAVGAGVVGWLLSGWFVAVFMIPAAVLLLPALLRKSPAAAVIDRLDAMEDWTRNLAGRLTVGMSIEKAIRASVGWTPAPLRTEVGLLVARLNSGWDTPAALTAFADDLDDATGDVIAAALIIGANERGRGLASVLDGLAQTVAEDVRARRAIEADRAKPRHSARVITGITAAVLGVQTFNDTFRAGYSTPAGQLILTVLLCAYVGLLVWMRQISRGRPTPRFLTGTNTAAPADLVRS